MFFQGFYIRLPFSTSHKGQLLCFYKTIYRPVCQKRGYCNVWIDRWVENRALWHVRNNKVNKKHEMSAKIIRRIKGVLKVYWAMKSPWSILHLIIVHISSNVCGKSFYIWRKKKEKKRNIQKSITIFGNSSPRH